MPARQPVSLALVVPGFAAQVRGQAARMPSLERLIAQSEQGLCATDSMAMLATWQVEIVRALRLPCQPLSYPSAPLTWLGLGGDPGPGVWLHADPVRMEPAATGLTLALAPAFDAGQLAALAERFHAYFSVVGLEWRTRAGCAFLRCPSMLDVRTVHPRYAVWCESLRNAWPSGPNGAEVRRLMTELQMLMHDMFDAPAGNALWLWGAGVIPSDVARADLPALWADEPYARGIYVAHGMAERCRDVASDFDTLQLSARTVIVIRHAAFEVLERHWFAPLLRALDAGELDRVEVYLDGVSVMTGRSTWRRMFARPRPLAALLP